MATTDLTAVFDAAFIREFAQYAPGEMAAWFKLMPESCYGTGVVQRDRLLEIVMAELSQGDYEVDSVDGWDFTDHTDLKTVTMNNRASSSGLKVLVTSITKKVGSLRVIAYNPVTTKFHYFFIWDYESVRNYGRVEWRFGSNSQYCNGTNGIEVGSVQELAQIPANFRG